MKPGQPFSVGMVLFEGVTQLDLTGPYEVFARMPATRVHLVARDTMPVRTEWGMTIAPEVSFDDAPALDLLCIPGGFGIDACLEDERMLAAAGAISCAPTGSPSLRPTGMLSAGRPASGVVADGIPGLSTARSAAARRSGS